MGELDRSRAGASLVMCAALLACGCGEQDARSAVATPRAMLTSARSAAAAPDDAVVARVNKTPITAAQLGRFWQEHPSMTREEVAEALVERELLVSSALTREESPAERKRMERAVEKGIARAWLEKHVDDAPLPPQYTPVVMEELVKTRQRSGGEAAGLQVSHLLVHVPFDEAKKKIPAARREKLFAEAKVLAESLAAKLPAQVSAAQLLQFVESGADAVKLPAPLALNMDLHLRFALPGDRRQKPEGWIDVDRQFAEGAEKLANTAPEGTLSAPVRSQFGWHLIVVERKFERAPLSREEARRGVDIFLQDGLDRKQFQKTIMPQLLHHTPFQLFPDELKEQRRTF